VLTALTNEAAMTEEEDEGNDQEEGHRTTNDTTQSGTGESRVLSACRL
jgi:hypothetical protein